MKRIFPILIILVFGIGLGIFVENRILLQQAHVQPIDQVSPVPSSWNSKENFPGNSFSTAMELQIGYNTFGTLNPGNILDYYFFTLKQSADIIITVTNVPKEFGFVLYDGSYNEVAHTYRFGSIEGTTKITLPKPGKYYIRVSGNYTEIVNVPYTIRLSVLPFVGD